MTTLKAADAQIPLTSEGGSGRPGPARTLAARIASDRRGDVAIIFGVMGFTMMLIVGGAVDFGRWLNARADTVKALDAAVLAGGRSLQLNNNEAAAGDVAKRYYRDESQGRSRYAELPPNPQGAILIALRPILSQLTGES